MTTPVDPELIRAASESGKRSLAEKYPSLAGRELDNLFSSKFDRWEKETQKGLEKNFPLKEEYRELENSESDLEHGRTDRELLKNDITAFSKLDSEKAEQIASSVEDSDPAEIHRTLISEWNGELERRKQEWVMAAIEKRRNELLDSLDKWLKLVETAKKATESLNLGTGILWDLTETSVFPSETQTLEKWASTFENDPNIRYICETLGRMCSSEIDEKAEEESPESSRTYIPDCNSSEEIAGLELGHRIEDTLPSELIFLDDPELEILFDRKYAENGLLCFSKQGYASIESDYVTKARRTDREVLKGPIIFCIDTSGSMSGTPEYIAKAFAFYVSMKAITENRNCFLINFSTSTDTLNLSPPKGMPELLKFMGNSFHGGTDIRPAMELAVRTTLEEEYRLADIIVVSDFVIPQDSLDFLKEDVRTAKERGCRFHSVSIGNFVFAPRLTDIFDECWEYNTVKGTVEVHNSARKVGS